MKPVASAITEVDTLDGDEVKFTISAKNSPLIMRSMADLYSNRELACIREYSTNAYDSNVEKALRDGHAVKPIHVTLPSAMNPYFEVQDYGVGMSLTELKETYTEFGESTKREGEHANAFNGTLGFGSKSAVAYTNTFTITSIKNGRMNVGVITRREDAMGGYLLTLKIVLEQVATNEPDGVKIQIPVHNWREFEQKARDFYRFWEPGRVLVNGKEPKRAVGEKIENNLYYNEDANGYASDSYVVMANVPYRIENPDALFPRGMNKISFVAYVGECNCDFYHEPHPQVEHVPAREALKYSDHTKHHLHKIIGDFVTKSVNLAKAEIAKATTHAEAYTTWVKWRKVIGKGQVDDLTFKGDKLVDDFKIEAMRYNTYAARYGSWKINSWEVSSMTNTLIITGIPSVDNINGGQKKKAKDWLGIQTFQAQYILFTEDTKVESPWIPAARVVSWERVKTEAPKPPKKPRAATVGWGRKAGSFDLITRNGRESEQDVPATKPLYYIMVQDFNDQQDRSNLRTVLSEFDVDEKVVLVAANRKAKFLRCYPHATPIMDSLRSKVKSDGPSLLTDDAKTFLKTNHDERRILSSMDETLVDDPEIKKVVSVFRGKTERDYTKDYARQMRLCSILGIPFKRHAWEGYWQAQEHPLTDKYPLAGSFQAVAKAADKTNKHVYLYINAVYAARKAGKNV